MECFLFLCQEAGRRRPEAFLSSKITSLFQLLLALKT